VGRAFAHPGVFIEGRAQCIESAEDFLDLQLVPFNLSLVACIVWQVRPPPESPLDLTHNSGIA